jgi:hypothetical protein
MRFSKHPGPSEEPCILHTWASENDAWRVEVYRVMFGCRVRARPTGSWSYVADYCFGADQVWIEAGVVALVGILSAHDESALPNDVQRTLPGYTVRPMARDAACWAALLRLARIAPAPVDDIAARIDDHDGPRRDYLSCNAVDSLLDRLELRNKALQPS